MTSKEIRNKLKNGTASIGTWLQIPSSDLAEIIGRLGYDWVALDLEHGAFSRSQLPDIFRAIERWGAVPMARLADVTRRDIKLALDSGAKGVIFPMIESAQELERAIHLSLYPGGKEFAEGVRGVGFCRANLFGMDFDEYCHSEGSGQEIVIVAQIEHINALKDLDNIFAHPRLDAYMIGPYDLSASMGLTGNFEAPEFLYVLEEIEKTAEKHGVPKGYHVVEPDEKALRDKISEGYSFLAYGIDAVFIKKGGQCPI